MAGAGLDAIAEAAGAILRTDLDHVSNLFALLFYNLFFVSPLLLLSIMRQESAFRSMARSSASAQGLMQIIPPTGRVSSCVPA